MKEHKVADEVSSSKSIADQSEREMLWRSLLKDIERVKSAAEEHQQVTGAGNVEQTDTRCVSGTDEGEWWVSDSGFGQVLPVCAPTHENTETDDVNVEISSQQSSGDGISQQGICRLTTIPEDEATESINNPGILGVLADFSWNIGTGWGQGPAVADTLVEISGDEVAQELNNEGECATTTCCHEENTEDIAMVEGVEWGPDTASGTAILEKITMEVPSDVVSVPRCFSPVPWISSEEQQTMQQVDEKLSDPCVLAAFEQNGTEESVARFVSPDHTWRQTAENFCEVENFKKHEEVPKDEEDETGACEELPQHCADNEEHDQGAEDMEEQSSVPFADDVIDVENVVEWELTPKCEHQESTCEEPLEQYADNIEDQDPSVANDDLSNVEVVKEWELKPKYEDSEAGGICEEPLEQCGANMEEHDPSAVSADDVSNVENVQMWEQKPKFEGDVARTYEKLPQHQSAENTEENSHASAEDKEIINTEELENERKWRESPRYEGDGSGAFDSTRHPSAENIEEQYPNADDCTEERASADNIEEQQITAYVEEHPRVQNIEEQEQEIAVNVEEHSRVQNIEEQDAESLCLFSETYAEPDQTVTRLGEFKGRGRSIRGRGRMRADHVTFEQDDAKPTPQVSDRHQGKESAQSQSDASSVGTHRGWDRQGETFRNQNVRGGWRYTVSRTRGRGYGTSTSRGGYREQFLRERQPGGGKSFLTPAPPWWFVASGDKTDTKPKEKEMRKTKKISQRKKKKKPGSDARDGAKQPDTDKATEKPEPEEVPETCAESVAQSQCKEGNSSGYAMR